MAYAKLASNMNEIQISDFTSVLLDNSKNWIFVKDEKFRILYANKTFLQIYPPEQRDKIIGTTTIENFSEEEAQVFLKEDRKAMDSGYSSFIEDITDYEGKVHTIQSQKIRFTDHMGRVLMLGICEDISKWAQREKMLAQTNIALENFAAIAAHDLRSPLGAFLSGIELIRLDKGNKLTQNSIQFLDMMKQSGEGLIAQIGALLSSYKRKNSKILELVEIDSGILIEEVKFNLAHVIAKQDAKILSTILPTLKVDRNLFRQLMHNLVENCIKYRSEEKPVIIIRHERSGKFHLFSIEDNGRGITSEQQENIFRLYEQVENGSDGYGIGLSLCRKIVEMHGGNIWVDPTYKAGCKILFTIPA